MTQAPERLEATADLVRRFLSLPEGDRSHAVAEQLRQFATMDPLQRTASMRRVLNELARLAPDERKAFLQARNRAFLDLPIGTRMALTGSRIEVLAGLPAERLQEEIEVLESLAPGLDSQQQTVLAQMLTATRAPTATHDQPVARKRSWKIWRR